MSGGIVRVVVIDDSPLCVEALRSVIDADPRMRVVGVGHDGLRAIELATLLRPTVITMDVHMPRMNGLDAIERIMAAQPTRILLVTEDDARGLPFEAIRRGAADVVRRPHPRAVWGAVEHDELRRKILTLAQTPMRLLGRAPGAAPAPLPPSPSSPGLVAPRAPSSSTRVSVVGIAGSTGGPAALATVLAALPPDFAAPILVVQHLAPGFVESFARWLDRESKVRVGIARQGEVLAPGDVRLAPDGMHLAVDRNGCVVLDPAPPIDGHRPSATRLFDSLAPLGARAAGVILTGMGRDGASGLLALRRAGGTTLAQDEASCIVFGMPRAARDAGAVCETHSPERLGARLASLVGRTRREGAA